MRTNKKKNKNGFSILEIVVAFGILTVGMLGLSSLVVQNIRAQTVNRNYLIASMLAQEGLELVRNIRDNNWLQFIAWNNNLNDGTFTIDFSGAGSIDDTPGSLDDSGARLFLDADNFYTHTAATSTPYSRLISIKNDASGNFLSASSTVRWADGSGVHKYTAQTLFYDWR